MYLKPGQEIFTQSKSSFLTKWDPELRASTESPKVGTNAPGTAATEVQIRLMPVSILESLQLPNATTPLTALIERSDYQVMQEPMALTLAGGPQDAAAVALLSEAEKASLMAFLARPPKTKPILVILDDAYPAQSDFLHAAEFVIKASREIRQKFGLLDDTHGDSPTLLKLEQTYRQGTLFCDEDCEYPKLKLHSAMIRESLRELTTLDTDKRVEVIYLPVNEAQPFSKELLTEILRVALLADSVTNGLVLIAPGIQPPPELQRGKPNYANVEMQVETILKPN